jgi:valacyclovir hydrolase
MSYFNWHNHQIFYRQQGAGPLLLVLPGNTASSICHQGELDYFGNRYQVASLDFLGTGQSDRIAEWAEDWWAEAATQAEGLVEHLGFKDCIAMGTSGGAAVALLMAILSPERVRAVIADSCPEKFAKAMARELRHEREQQTESQVRFWQFTNGATWKGGVAADTAMLLHFAARGGDWFSSRLNEIRCPVLLTASKEDNNLVHASQQLSRMCDQIANSRLFLNHRGGHPLMWSSPRDFRAVSDYFLEAVKTEPPRIL